MDLEFFDQLYRNCEFCSQLGKVTLAAGRFEFNLRAYLILRGVNVSQRDASLGPLIARLENHGMLSENGVRVLRGLKDQRNYLTHCLFDLFLARVDETLLPRPDAYPPDLTVYTEKAWELEQNLLGLNAIVEKQIASLEAQGPSAPAEDELLFRP